MVSEPLAYRALDELQTFDLEAVRLALQGSSVIDWARLELHDVPSAREFVAAHEFHLDDAASRARTEAIKNAAIAFLRRNFDFPVPKPVAQADVAELLVLASGRGHRQVCACTILKVIHIIHHLEARELLFMLPISDQDVFHLAEQKVRRVIGGMMARDLPIVEFVGGRKNKDSLYTKLLSKRETHAAQIYDKLRFRIVTRSSDDVFPVLSYLMRHLFPFNYVVPGESTNTLFDFRAYLARNGRLAEIWARMQPLSLDSGGENENVFSAPSYRVVHFVADMPVRLTDEILEVAPPAAWSLGRVVFAQAEFQIVDRETEQANELGEASHDAYKLRQKQAVMRRLKVGTPSVVQSTPPVSPRREPMRTGAPAAVAPTPRAEPVRPAARPKRKRRPGRMRR